MFSKNEIKQNLIGCAEIMLFMQSGIERFEQISKKDAVKSFVIPVLLLPLVLTILVLTSKEGYTTLYLIMVHSTRIIAGIIAYLLVVFYFSRLLKRREHFAKYVVVVNWSGLINVLLLPPILIYALSGAELQGIEAYAVFVALLGYVYLGFILTFALRIPWEMGGFMAVIGIFVDETMWDILFYFCGELTAISGT